MILHPNPFHNHFVFNKEYVGAKHVFFPKILKKTLMVIAYVSFFLGISLLFSYGIMTLATGQYWSIFNKRIDT